MLSSRILIALSVGLLFVVTASATPVLDGNIDDGEYPAVWTLTDVDEGGIPNGLDIKSVGFDVDPGTDGFFYIGVEVWGEPITTNGGADTILGQTRFYARFESGGGTDMLQINVNGSISVILNGVVLDTADYGVMTNGGLELKIDKDLLSPEYFTFFGQMDDTGFGNDDQIVGVVNTPEPVTLALIAVGLPLAMIRRRRR